MKKYRVYNPDLELYLKTFSMHNALHFEWVPKDEADVFPFRTPAVLSCITDNYVVHEFDENDNLIEGEFVKVTPKPYRLPLEMIRFNEKVMEAKKVQIITHTDMDGIASGRILRKYFYLNNIMPHACVDHNYPEISFIDNETGMVAGNINYANHPGAVDNLTMNPAVPVIITDLDISAKQYERFIEEGITFIVIDHHQGTKNLDEKYDGYNYYKILTKGMTAYDKRIMDTASAALLVHGYIASKYSPELHVPDKLLTQSVFSAIRAISDADTANIRHVNPETFELDYDIISDKSYWPFLMSIFCGNAKFEMLKQLMEIIMDLEASDLDDVFDNEWFLNRVNFAITTAKVDYERMMNSRVVNVNEKTNVLCLDFFPKCLTWLSISLFDYHPEIATAIAILDREKHSMSFRSCDESPISALDLAKYSGGGGHVLAAGTNNPEGVEKMMELLKFPKNQEITVIEF